MAEVVRGSAIFTYRDYDDEAKSLEVLGVEIDDVNYAAQTTKTDALRDAINGVVYGELNGYDVVARRGRQDPKVLPSNEEAQREHQWLIQGIDSVTRAVVTARVPCANPVGRLVANTNEADMTNGDIAALKTAYEDYAISPDGNPITVQKVLYVSRNG